MHCWDPAIALWLQSTRLAGRVAEFGSLGGKGASGVRHDTYMKTKAVQKKRNSRLISVTMSCWLAAMSQGLSADTVTLQQATATFSQTEYGDFSVSRAVNGTVGDALGWAIYPLIGPQIAVFETSSDLGFEGSSVLTFRLVQTYSSPPGHTLGRFRLSVTTDDRNFFADGLATGGDVTANWIVLDPISFVSTNGATLTTLVDHSILAAGSSPPTDVYTVTAGTSLTGITGIRLEALTDPSLPQGGPGREPGTGNFVLSEFEVSIALELARLNISSVGTAAIQITWATNFADRVLEYATGLPAAGWSTVTNAPATTGDHLSVIVETATSQRFYRLRKP